MSAWPQSLRTAVDATLGSAFPSILVWGPELVVVAYSDAYIDLIGSTHPRALGLPVFEAWPEIVEINGPRFADVLTGETVSLHDAPYLLQRRGPDAPPDECYFTASMSPIRDESGVVRGILSVLFETTLAHQARALEADRERLLLEAETSRRRLHELFRQAPAFIAVLRGPRFVFELANDEYQRFVRRGDLVGKPLFDVIPDARDQGFEELLQRVLETGEPYVGREQPITFVAADGRAAERRYATFVYAPLAEPDGSRSGVFVHGVDVTDAVIARHAVESARDDAQQAAIALAVSEMRLRAEVARREQYVATLEQATDFIGIATPDGSAYYVNPAARQLVGITDDETAMRTTLLDYFPPAWHRRVRDELLPALLRDGQWRGEVVFRHFVTGEEIPVEWIPFVVRDPSTGEIAALSCVARDLRTDYAARMEREQLLAETEAARRAAESASRAKDDFLAMVSHELRSPLAGIAINAQMMLMDLCGPVTEKQREALVRIANSQTYLLGLIEQLLDLKKMAAGHMRYDLVPVHVRDTLVAAAAIVEPQFERSAIDFTMRFDGTSHVARADVGKLEQIVINLLSNAAKFTPSGGRVTLLCAGDAETIRVDVCDTGIGIDAEQLEQVFHPFVQVRDGRQPNIGGTGLGLAISRDFARGMGGDLTVESTPGEGSRFTLTLPAS
jgi:PAS domain S-box-containing protein